MSRTSTQSSAQRNKARAKRRETTKTLNQNEVLTLTEAAAYLRVSPEVLQQIVKTEAIPGRRLGTEWRFLKTALQDWLATPREMKKGLLEHLGAVKDDPYLEEMLEEIFRQRGRPRGEEG
jgi:excisionase family DNA binding protein